MISLAALVLDLIAAGQPVPRSLLDAIPSAQWEIYFYEMNRLCPSRMELDVERRPGNALN